VIFQVRFPTILRIEAETPSAFQECIRARFPLLERIKSPLQGKIPPEILSILGHASGAESYGFTSEDASSKITLSSESLAVSTASYLRWESFRADVDAALQALVHVYAPTFFSRIGLRYQNLLRQSVIGLNCPWADLIRPELAGELTIPEWAAAAQSVQKAIRCRINQLGDHFTLQHGLAETEGSTEVSYLIDFDYFTESKTEIANVHAVLDRLHGHSGNAFRWAISEALHQAMDPQEG
jgi:uncharacterized protein (TIGR04255 family)